MQPDFAMYRPCAAYYPGSEHSADLCRGGDHTRVLSAAYYPSGEHSANLRWGGEHRGSIAVGDKL